MYTILLVDDEKNLRTSIAHFFSLEGIETEEASNGLAAQQLLMKHHFDAVITDLKMPGMNGLELLEWIGESGPDIPVFMISAFGEVEDAVQAMKKGAVDYVVKPFDPEELILRLRRELERRKLQKLTNTIPTDDDYTGESPAMRQLFSLARKVAPTASNVLITGESGTGKEVMARFLHNHSDRSKNNFQAVNLGGIPESLMESELFGYEKGSFTGADHRKIGYFEASNGGTIFLDEVGEAPLALQVKLLRVLQEKAVTRVGGTGTIPLDIRIIAATNKDLDAMVKARDFRDDLYYRLNVIHLQLPALRERREDIPFLAETFRSKFASSMGKTITGFSDDAMKALQHYSFPGNIRELENMVERAMILAEPPLLERKDFPLHQEEGPQTPKGSLRELEREAILEALLRNNGHREKSAAELGITRRTLLNKINEYGISIPE
ncbi:sigma-54-dependent transcriptional regulator [Sediminispirochaeta smaragdinae]|jgi:two-component system response regulator AtoC|uniref:Two component, sigma54 specific, transcriptional regulator, Fis family n=1 Tax=Sediminispirochaeta smaragdinae (strain DSM 11293 / JCM 15392 / SEBR 4228) TaxID=573413 RepID=E1RBB1_SEDSS|nr:sigma-54 dependent transcriptional regulator [Sediminispirochaeta smaragdinae]ADK79641.1 two component, sigma54 specific, transcriptional regulator, Fis family [Sediminispirochaeta smaragdinae DSM 11293]